uniref:Protein transport protein Sec24-like CEF n=1 Tax=Auxenochlorella protothecoides TaxID=3075 RepID=A0A1D2A1I9_AUXPR
MQYPSGPPGPPSNGQPGPAWPGVGGAAPPVSGTPLGAVPPRFAQLNLGGKGPAPEPQPPPQHAAHPAAPGRPGAPAPGAPVFSSGVAGPARPIPAYNPQPGQQVAQPARPYPPGPAAAPHAVQQPHMAPGAMRTSGAVRQPGAYGGQQPGAYGVQQLGAYSGQLPGTRPGQPPATGPQRPQAPAQPGRVASSGAAGVQEGPPPATGAQPSVSHVAYPPSTPARQPPSPAAGPRQPPQGAFSPPPLAVNVATPPRAHPGLGVPAGFVPVRGPPAGAPQASAGPAHRGGLAARPMPGYTGAPPLWPGPPGAPGPPPAEGYIGQSPAAQMIAPGRMGTPPGAAGAGYFGAPAPAKRNDPRPALSPQLEMVFETRRGGDHSIPPPCSTPLVVRDKGSAGPHHMRSTLNLVPQTPALFRKLKLPFGLVINPMAAPGLRDDPIPTVDLGPGGPVRCAECKAYVNAYFRFVADGGRMVCNFCGAEQPVPPGYACPLDMEGRRRDAADRPELCCGSVDMVATAEYMVRPPAPPTHLFLIEAGAGAAACGATAAAAAAVASVVEGLPEPERARVALATFDASLTFYDLTRSGGAAAGAAAPAAMLVQPDVDDAFSPLPAGGVGALAAVRDTLLATLAALPAAAAASGASEAAGGAALAAAVTALGEAGGGRLHAFLATLPRRGRPASRPREVPRALADRDALDALHPDGAAWGELAARAAEAQVRPELYCLAAGPYMDVASLDAFARGAAGSLRFYPGFHAPADAARLQDDLRWALARPAGLEAVGRLRVSTGLSVGRCWGAFHRRTPTDLHFPAIDADQALAASIEVDEKLAERGEAYAQFALLYTSPAGRRLVRVHTLALPITTGRSSAFRGADMDAVLALTARRVAAQAPGKALGACRDAVMAAAVDLLVAYRQHAAQQSDTSQLLLPEALQLLPLFSLGLSKNALFRRGVASWGWSEGGRVPCCVACGLLPANHWLLPVTPLVHYNPSRAHFHRAGTTRGWTSGRCGCTAC